MTRGAGAPRARAPPRRGEDQRVRARPSARGAAPAAVVGRVEVQDVRIACRGIDVADAADIVGGRACASSISGRPSMVANMTSVQHAAGAALQMRKPRLPDRRPAARVAERAPAGVAETEQVAELVRDRVLQVERRVASRPTCRDRGSRSGCRARSPARRRRRCGRPRGPRRRSAHDLDIAADSSSRVGPIRRVEHQRVASVVGGARRAPSRPRSSDDLEERVRDPSGQVTAAGSRCARRRRPTSRSRRGSCPEAVLVNGDGDAATCQYSVRIRRPSACARSPRPAAPAPERPAAKTGEGRALHARADHGQRAAAAAPRRHQTPTATQPTARGGTGVAAVAHDPQPRPATSAPAARKSSDLAADRSRKRLPIVGRERALVDVARIGRREHRRRQHVGRRARAVGDRVAGLVERRRRCR